MQACDYSPYTLPTIDFVAGESQDLLFHTYFHAGKRPFDMTGCTANFSIVNFLNRMGSPIVSKVMTISENPALESNNQLLVHLDTDETVELSGKYIYQVTIKDAEGNVEIPKQGILLITKNIDKGFIS